MKLNLLFAILLSLVIISQAAPTRIIEKRDYTRTVKKRYTCPSVIPPGEPSCGIGH